MIWTSRRRGVALGLAATTLLHARTGLTAGLPFAPGERIDWTVHYGGIQAGSAWAEARREGDDWVFQGGCRNAPWYEVVYHIEDALESRWRSTPPGSLSYTTRFREGGFHQDQRMELSTSPFRVSRRQRFKEGWRDWSNEYPSPGTPVEDPLSAFYRVRTCPLEPGAVCEFPVFSGKRTWTFRAQVGPREVGDTALGSLPLLPLSIQSLHQGDLEQKGRILLYVSDDPRHVPVRAVMETNVGRIRAELSGYQEGAVP